MKTNQLHQLLRSKLLIAIAMLLVSCVLQGQTYRILKASNDPGVYTDREEVSKVLDTEPLKLFNFLCETSSLVGAVDGQEFTLVKVPGFCKRTHSDIPDFTNMGMRWMATNPNLQMIMLDVKSVDSLSQFAECVTFLKQSSGVRYVVIMAFPDLCPDTSLSMYEEKSLEIITPAVGPYLNELYVKGIRVFFKAMQYK